MHGGQRVQPCVLAIGQGNREVAQGLRIGYGIERAHALLAAVLLGLAARAIDLHRRQLLVHRTGGDALCEQGLRVEIHPNLPVHAANAGDGRHPIDAIQGARHIAIDEPRHFIGRHRRRIHRISQQRADDFHFRNHRLLDVLRQVHADARDGILGIVQRFQQVGVDAKFDHRGGLPIHHRGKHALDVVERGHRVFHLARHFGFQLLRRRAGLGDDHRHHRKTDVGEACHRQLLKAPEAGHAQHEEQHDRRHRVADAPGGKGATAAHGALPLAATMRIRSPSDRKPAPVLTTCAPAFSPLRISTLPPSRLPGSTRTRVACLPSRTTNT